MRAFPWEAHPKVKVVFQTTLNADGFAEHVAEMRRRVPDLRVADTICYATKENQDALRVLCADPSIDAIVVIGGHHSKNTKELVKIAEELEADGLRRHGGRPRPGGLRRDAEGRRHRRGLDARLRRRGGPGEAPGDRLTGRPGRRRLSRMEIKGAGGTPGGVGLFLGGLAMMVVGGYLLLQQVQVHSGFWDWFGPNTFGLTLIPLLVGIGFLFFDGKSVAGWLLTGAGALIIVAGIIANLQIWFRPTSLYNTLVMLGLLAGGVGLVARSLKAKPEAKG